MNYRLDRHLDLLDIDDATINQYLDDDIDFMNKEKGQFTPNGLKKIATLLNKEDRQYIYHLLESIEQEQLDYVLNNNTNEYRITLFNKDYHDLLSMIVDNSIGLVLTDPPYIETSIGKTNINSNQSSGVSGGFYQDFDVQFANDDGFYFKEISRVLKPHGYALIFTGVNGAFDKKQIAQKNGLQSVGELYWTKNNVKTMSDMNSKQKSNHYEEILVFQKPRYNNELLSMVLANKTYMYGVDNRHRIHPTQKPKKLLKQLITQFSNPNDIILDPFAGSFSTIGAAQELSRSAIGSDIDPITYKTAINNNPNIKKMLEKKTNLN